MELETLIIPQRTELNCNLHINLEEGDKLKVKGAGELLLNESCPEDKKWEAYVVVTITETDK